MDLYRETQQAATDAETLELIERWLRIEFAGVDSRTRTEQRAQLYESAAGRNREWMAESMAAAEDDPDVWEGLRRYALQRAKEGHSPEPELAALLLSGAPKRKRGRQEGGSPFTETLNMLYARAVWSIYHAGKGRYVLESSGKGANNAFALVAQAAEPITGATFDEVRNACKGGQLERLTKLYRQAHEYGLTGWHPGITLQRGK